MESHLVHRPRKIPYGSAEQERLRDVAIGKLKHLLLPNPRIRRIILIGSSVKGTFGTYEAPGFRGSLYSDFDFIVFVSDDYLTPVSLQREPDGKPFADARLNLAYRIRNFVEEKYDAEVFFVREGSVKLKDIELEGERAGIPMTKESTHPFIEIGF